MSESRESLFDALAPDEQIRRLYLAVETMASWLVQAQTGFGVRDAEGIHNILDHGTSRQEPSS